MSTTDTAEKEHKGNDTAEDELQSEPLDPEESSAPDGNRVNDNCSNVPDKQEAVSSQGLEDTPKNKEDAEMTRDPAGFEDKQEAVSSQGLEDTPKNKEDAEMTRDPGFEESVLSQGLEDTPKNKEDAKMTRDPGFEDKQEAVSSRGLEDTPKNKEDAEMTRDPGFEESVLSQGLEDTPKNKEDAEMTRDPGFEESVLSQGLEDTPKNKEDAEMTGDPGFEDDDITDNRHDDDVEMGSQSSDKTDPVPDNNGEEDEKDKWSEGESATGEGKDKGKGKESNDDSDDDGWGRPWRFDNWGQSKKSRKIVLPKLSRYSSFDTEQYRTGYPGKRDNPRVTENLEFYTNEIPSFPEGDYVDVIHEKWWGKYDLLEYHHSYIQWLFPIRERGLNWHAKELQLHEIEKIKGDEKAIKRVLKSYKLMLDFYGLELVDEKSGEVKRSVNWKDRFRNLNYSSHNYLRITRILKCLGEFGFEHLKEPLIRHLLIEAITEKTLINALNSCVSYWIEVVKDDKEKEELHSYARTLVQEANNKIAA